MLFRPWVGRIGGLNKLDAGFEHFHIFYAKKRPLFSIFGPPYFWAEDTIFFGDLTIFFSLGKKITGLVPPPDPSLLISPNLKRDSSLRHLCRGGNTGGAAARRRGIGAASGRFLTFF